MNGASASVFATDFTSQRGSRPAAYPVVPRARACAGEGSNRAHLVSTSSGSRPRVLRRRSLRNARLGGRARRVETTRDCGQPVRLRDLALRRRPSGRP
jgi:hypothetical protein